MAIHCVPDNDDQPHSLTLDCACDPEVTFEDPEIGGLYPHGPLVIHNSYDCREVVEPLIEGAIAPDKLWSVFEA